MTENTPGSSKKPMAETIETLKNKLSASNIKYDKSLLPYIGGLLVLMILLAVFLGIQQYSLSQRFDEMATSLTNLETRIGGLEKQQTDLQAKTPLSCRKLSPSHLKSVL